MHDKSIKDWFKWVHNAMKTGKPGFINMENIRPKGDTLSVGNMTLEERWVEAKRIGEVWKLNDERNKRQEVEYARMQLLDDIAEMSDYE